MEMKKLLFFRAISYRISETCVQQDIESEQLSMRKGVGDDPRSCVRKAGADD